ncbi:Mannose-binding lectin [Cynara cardunculus var. scolymus]|uniref:Mannose-binding lectin n=1 Tax=Cynara cardunculus var. scolymus TaxID=59895 RepID=A0A103XBT3_CYNCS|nr:Mannose-binding lectin [Cynara cardunculus var. scolymus]
MASQVEVGPWRGDGGVNPWTFKPNGRIVGFRIASGDVIDSIRFTYEDNSQVSHHSDTYGGDGGTLNLPAKFDDDEDLIRVSGTIGKFYSITVITSLSFHSNKGKSYGPYGRGDRTSFSLPVTKGKFIRFFGNYGDFLDSIGVILQP